MIQTTPNSSGGAGPVARTKSCPSFELLRKSAVPGLALVIAAFLVPSASAQYIRFRAPQVRVTVPANTGTSTLLTNLVRLSGISNNPPVALDISPTLPPGASVQLSTYTVTTNNTPLDVTVNATNVPVGIYTFSLNASGVAATNGLPVTNNFFFTLECGYIWNGSTNALADGAGQWSDASKWLSGGVPGPGDDVIFSDSSGQSNSVYTIGGVVTNAPLVNSIVADDTMIGSLRFSQTNRSSRFNTIQINAGKTLAITGTNGLTYIRDYVSSYLGINAGINVSVVGVDGTLVVSNQSANIAILGDNTSASSSTANTLNLTDLGTFVADVHRIGLGDYQLWPHFDNLSTDNGYNGIPRNFYTYLSLARTNMIRATYVDPDNFTNSVKRDYSLTLGNNERGGTSSNPQYWINFGITNAFFLDSICFAHGSLSSRCLFPPVFATNYDCVAYFRGTNGGRMSVWAASDLGQGDEGQGSGSNDKTTMDFSNGRVDALVDNLYLSRDRLNSLDGGNAQSTLILSMGTFDANTAILGYQTEVGHTNVAYCQGTLVVSNTAVFKANNILELGYTTEDPTNSAATPENNRGIVNLGPGGTVMANSIDVGGLTKLSAANAINLNGGGANLIVTNTIASADKALTTLNFGGDSTLTLHVDGSHTGPYVYVTNLITSGANNTIAIASLQNITLPATVPLISYVSLNGTVPNVEVPSGYTAALLDDQAGTISLSVTTHSPLNLRWQGATADWDTTSKNWYDMDHGTMTNFANGDFVTFDGNPAYPSTINIVTPSLIPSGVTVSNSSLTYTFVNAGGSISGSAVLTKTGTGSLTNDATTTLAVHVEQGRLGGSGSIAGAVISSGASMQYSGTVIGSVDSSGSATLDSFGMINGPVTVLDGGTVTNLGTINGPLTLEEGSLLYNDTFANMQNVGNATVATNATLINAGAIHGMTLVVSGTLEDLGTGGIYLAGDTVNGTRGLIINSGATFIPGGEGIGTTLVLADPSANTYPGRVLLAAGSTNIFKVDVANAQPNTKLLSTFMGFGPNQNAKSQNGCTLVIANVGATPFSAGQVFKMFGYSGAFGRDGDIKDAGLNTTNSYPLIDPPAPGPGLAWDLSNLIPGGYIGVRSVATDPAPLQFITSFGPAIFTNISGNTTNYVTNSALFTQFVWPTNYIGWRLQEQQNPLNVGLSTNWSDVWTYFTNQIFFTNVITTNAATAANFYRMVYP